MSRPRVLLAGTQTPFQRVLQQLDRFGDLVFVGAYTAHDASPEIRKLCDAQQLRIGDIEQLRRGANAEALPEYDWLLSVNSVVVFADAVIGNARAGALNMHPGKLPEYAGLHTHQWAIRNGETEFAATLHWIEPTIDTGHIAYTTRFAIEEQDTGLTLFLKCLNAGTQLVLRALDAIQCDQPIPRIPQDLTRRKLYRHRDALDGRIDWQHSADQLARFVRAGDYAPFRSPTYEPRTTTPRGSVRVRKASLAGSVNAIPGTVVDVGSDGIVIACGDRAALRVTALENEQGQQINKRSLAEAGFRVGEVWQ